MKRKTPSIDKQLHPAHVAILHVLLFRPHARFAMLQKEAKLSSDHFNFYLQQLLNEGFVQKNDAGAYRLTTKGKEFANRFDTDARVVERQPKVAVCLLIYGNDGKELVQQRLKQPYYGYWGRPTGKIRWGETILESAARELFEETGLTADLSIREIYHSMDFKKQTTEMLEDKIFFVVECHNTKGALIETFDGGRNVWMTPEEYAEQEFTWENAKVTRTKIRETPAVPIIEMRHDIIPETY